MSAGAMGFRRCAAVLLAGLLAACTSDVEPLTPAQRQVMAAYVSKTAPFPKQRLDVDFGGKAKLLGYDVERAEWRPGETLRVVWYWQVLEPLGKGWKLFTHIETPDGGEMLTQDANGALRWLFGADRWRAGQYIEDPQDLYLPEDWPANEARLYVGFWRDDQRLSVSAGQPDDDGRARVASIPTPRSASEPPRSNALPRLVAPQTRRPPRLDGSLDDPVWHFANTSRTFVETRHGGPAPLQASAKVLWDRRYLYIGVDVRDALLRASHQAHDDHLWEQDCVELMIDPDGNGKNYFEIQVSPRGLVFDTRYDSRRVPKPFGRVDWSSKARVGVAPRGTIDDDLADAGYSVEVAIPWQAFSPTGKPARPPAIGDEWRANFYVMDLGASGQEAAAWSHLQTGDFHVPQRFGILAFEGPADDMLGTSEPLQINEDRLPKPLERPAPFDRDLEEKLMKQRAMKRRQPGEPMPALEPKLKPALEPDEGPH
jgi:hypothetical protein